MSSQSEDPSESTKETYSRKFFSRWFAYVGVVGILFVASMIYGAVCESKCETLCNKEGFPISTWNGQSGVWSRLFAAMNAKHGTCECYRERPATSMFYNGPAKVLRLNFN